MMPSSSIGRLRISPHKRIAYAAADYAAPDFAALLGRNAI
jgi:hypothetical protein